MRSFKLFHTLLIFLIGTVFSCSDEEVNRTPVGQIRMSDFQIRGLEPTGNGTFACWGSSEDGTKTTIFEYSVELEVIRTIDVEAVTGLPDAKYLQRLRNGDWLIGTYGGWRFGILPPSDPFEIKLYRTDSDLNILNEFKAYSVPMSAVSVGPVIYQIEELRNGDILFVYDTNQGAHGFRITRLDPELNMIFTEMPFRQNPHPRSASGFVWINSPRCIELKGGTIACVFFRSEVIWKIRNVSFQDGDSIQVGLLAADGKQLAMNSIEMDFTHAQVSSLSSTDQSLIVGTIVNDEHLHHYYSFNINDLSLRTEKLSDESYLNHRWAYPNRLGHFKEGEGNAMPAYFTERQGYFIYSEQKEKLAFVDLNDDIDLQERFSVNLPPLAQIGSYRQYFPDENEIVLAVSYAYQDRENLTVLRMDRNGKLLNE